MVLSTVRVDLMKWSWAGPVHLKENEFQDLPETACFAALVLFFISETDAYFILEDVFRSPALSVFVSQRCTRFHKPGDLLQQKRVVHQNLETTSLESRGWQGWLLLGTLRENLFVPLS